MRLDHLLSKEQAKQETAELHPKGRSERRASSFSKELSQDSRADKSQQLKKETKDQQRTHSVKEEIC